MKTAEEVAAEAKETKPLACEHQKLMSEACGACERTGVKVVDVTPEGEEAAQKARIGLEKTFHVEVESYVEAARWGGVTRQSGTFTVRRLDIGAKGRIGIHVARLNGGQPLDSIDHGTFRLHNVIAYLREAIVAAPQWWTPEQFLDGQILFSVYREVDAWETTFRRGAASK